MSEKREESNRTMRSATQVANANFTVSKKAPKEWSVKRDGVDGYSYHKTKASAFAKAESQIREVKGREGRIKIHEDGKYTSNWFVESNKQAKLASGSQDEEIIALLKAQKAKIQELNKVKATTPIKAAPSALAKSAKEDVVKANKAIEKLESEHDNLRKADRMIDEDIALIKKDIESIIKDKKHIKNSSKWEKALLIIMFIFTLSMFVYIVLVATGEITGPWK